MKNNQLASIKETKVIMINRVQFSIEIKADKVDIWKTLWDDNSYRDWAGVFFEGSYLTSDNWVEKSKVLFLGPDENGIYSIIETHIPNKTISFKHIGNVVNGEEQPIDAQTEKWSGCTETYSLSEGKNSIKLTVEIDILDEHLDFMNKSFPKALEKIKENCS